MNKYYTKNWIFEIRLINYRQLSFKKKKLLFFHEKATLVWRVTFREGEEFEAMTDR